MYSVSIRPFNFQRCSTFASRLPLVEIKCSFIQPSRANRDKINCLIRKYLTGLYFYFYFYFGGALDSWLTPTQLADLYFFWSWGRGLAWGTIEVEMNFRQGTHFEWIELRFPSYLLNTKRLFLSILHAIDSSNWYLSVENKIMVNVEVLSYLLPTDHEQLHTYPCLSVFRFRRNNACQREHWISIYHCCFPWIQDWLRIEEFLYRIRPAPTQNALAHLPLGTWQMLSEHLVQKRLLQHLLVFSDTVWAGKLTPHVRVAMQMRSSSLTRPQIPAWQVRKPEEARMLISFLTRTFL